MILFNLVSFTIVIWVNYNIYILYVFWFYKDITSIANYFLNYKKS